MARAYHHGVLHLRLRHQGRHDAFHSWLPDAHSEAPAPISAILSGLVITIGPFCFARTVSLFSPHYSQIFVFLSAIACASIVLGSSWPSPRTT